MSGSALKSIVLAAGLVTLGACATTTLQSTWKNPSAAPVNAKGKKVVALVLIPDAALRFATEEEAANEITAHGAVGVPAYRLLPQGPRGPQGMIPDEERARVIFEREGIEAVVVLRPVAKEKALSGSFSGYPGGFWGAGPWGGDGYLRTDTILVVETLVYSLQQNQLVWAAQSQTMNPTQLGPFMRDLSKTLGTEMEKQGLLG